MELANLFYTHIGHIFIVVNLFYFVIICALLCKILVKGERRRALQRMLLAFTPLLLVAVWETLSYLNYGEAEQYECISVLSGKLFIGSTFFTYTFMQSAGFVSDKLSYGVLYQVIQYSVLSIIDVLYRLFDMEICGYVLIMFVIIVLVMLSFALKFFYICLKRFDTMITILKKENFIEAFAVIFIMLLSSYIIMITLFVHENVFVSVLSLVMLGGIQLKVLYINWISESAKKNYKRIKSDNLENEILMDGQTMDDYKIIQRLILYFESHKPYLDSELKLADVSKQIYTNRTYLSRALNHRLSKNSNQFVNYYRVKEACRIYIENPLIKINEMSSKSGFKNLSSFSTAFSFNLRYTPAEWCKEVRRRLNNKEHVSIEDYFK